MATGEGTSRDAAKAGIVVVKVLLGMIVGVDISVGVDHGRCRSALNSWDIVGRERALELGRSGHVLIRRRRHDWASLDCVLRDVLEVKGMTERSGSTLKACKIGDLTRTSVDRR